MVSSVSVIGLGKLGAPMAACFAARGFTVHAVDLNPQKVDAISRGVPPVREPGLAELLAESGGPISATKDIEAAVSACDATFVVVATPSEADGGFSLRYVIPTCESIGRALRTKSAYHVVVVTSTVMPGSMGGQIRSALERASGKRCGIDFGLCYNPEFIALGTVIRDFYNPDFLLIGESDPRAGDALCEIYKRACKNSPSIARMNWINAEITKLSVNTYITTKISYANMLARLCEKLPEADVNVVTDALGRDNRALAALASRVGASSGLAEATDIFNRSQIHSLADIVKSHRSESDVIGILGLTYKPDTDVVEESFGLLLAVELSSANLPVIVYDPSGDAASALRNWKSIRVASSAQECIAESRVVVLATPWQEFRDLRPALWARAGYSAPRVVIDCWRALSHLDGIEGLRYVKLGFGGAAQKPVGVSSSAANS